MAPRPVETIKKKAIADIGLRANDVLFGRGSGPSQYEGNRRFRCVVWETLQDYIQGEQAKHFHRNEKLDSSLPTSLSTGIKSRLCRIVHQKITRMDGRFLQKVTSAEDMTKAENRLICVTHNEDGKEPYGSTYYKVVNKKKVLEKIRQTLRFLLDQKFGRKERSDCVKVTEAITVGVESSGVPSSASAIIPAGILSQHQNLQDTSLASPNDVVVRLQPECPALSPSSVAFARHNATTLDILTNTQMLLILHQRQQQRRQDIERVLCLLQVVSNWRRSRYGSEC
jgi:hypothetical protein